MKDVERSEKKGTVEPLTETARKIGSMEIRGAGRIARAAAASLRDLAQQLDVKASRSSTLGSRGGGDPAGHETDRCIIIKRY